jgi:hypothetical protein
VVDDIDDPTEFWHHVIENHRIDDEAFDSGVTLTLAMALLTSTNRDLSGVSPERMLERLREWYGDSMERRAVLALLSHFKDEKSREPIRRIGRALWSTHRSPCADPKECSLHSLGTLWAHRWKERADDERWIVDALETLLHDHPLRGWTRLLVSRLADWVTDGSLTMEEVIRLLTAALDAGLAGHMANTSALAEDWSRLTSASSPEGPASLVLAGNRMIAGGLTCLIGPQLRLLAASRASSTPDPLP